MSTTYAHLHSDEEPEQHHSSTPHISPLHNNLSPTSSSPPSSSPLVLSKRTRLLLGFSFLTFCVITYTSQTALLQRLETHGGFRKPYLLLWFAHSGFVLLIPIGLLVDRYLNPADSTSHQSTLDARSPSSVSDVRPLPRLSSFWIAYKCRMSSLCTRPFASFVWTNFWLATLYTIPNYLWYMVLPLTSMAEVTSIFNTNCFFAYLFSVFLLRETLSALKLSAVFLSIVGVVLLSLQSSASSDTPSGGSTSNVNILGDFITLISAVLYGLYSVLYSKYAVPKHPSLSLANQITGWIGIFTLTTQWVPIPFLHLAGVERFEFPSSTIVGFLVINMLMAVLYNALFMLTIVITSPVFATVGIMLTIPFSILYDYLANGKSLSFMGLSGCILIAIGFILLSFSQHKQRKDSEEKINIAEDEQVTLVSDQA